jgi:hypothetical protein
MVSFQEKEKRLNELVELARKTDPKMRWEVLRDYSRSKWHVSRMTAIDYLKIAISMLNGDENKK